MRISCKDYLYLCFFFARFLSLAASMDMNPRRASVAWVAADDPTFASLKGNPRYDRMVERR